MILLLKGYTVYSPLYIFIHKCYNETMNSPTEDFTYIDTLLETSEGSSAQNNAPAPEVRRRSLIRKGGALVTLATIATFMLPNVREEPTIEQTLVTQDDIGPNDVIAAPLPSTTLPASSEPLHDTNYLDYYPTGELADTPTKTDTGTPLHETNSPQSSIASTTVAQPTNSSHSTTIEGRDGSSAVETTSPINMNKIVILGDSIVANHGNETPGWVDIVEQSLHNDPVTSHVTVENLAVPGQTIGTENPLSNSANSRLLDQVQDYFLGGDNTPDTVLLTPSINEINSSKLPSQEKIVKAADDINAAVHYMKSMGVENVIVLPTPPVASAWGYFSQNPEVFNEIASLNDELLARGILTPVDYGMDTDLDGKGDEQFFDNYNNPNFNGGGADSLHPDSDGHLKIGQAVSDLLHRATTTGLPESK